MDVKKEIDAIFAAATHQAEVVAGLYRLFIPDFDSVADLKGWPTAGSEISRYIWDHFIEFDSVHHPDVMAGGCWLNYGFSARHKVPAWEVDLSTCTIIRKGKQEAGYG